MIRAREGWRPWRLGMEEGVVLLAGGGTHDYMNDALAALCDKDAEVSRLWKKIKHKPIYCHVAGFR